MLHIHLKQFRVLVVIGTLFFFVDCAGRVKSWKFYDSQSLEVKVLNTRDWLDSVKDVITDLDIIMDREIRYYLDRDMRIYNRTEPNYEAMVVSINTIDSVLLRITSVHDLMKNTPGDSLQSVPEDSSLSYSEMIKSSSKDIALAIKAYNKGLKAKYPNADMSQPRITNAVQMVAKAINEAGSATDMKAIAYALEGMEFENELLQTKVIMRAKDHQAIQNVHVGEHTDDVDIDFDNSGYGIKVFKTVEMASMDSATSCKMKRP